MKKQDLEEENDNQEEMEKQSDIDIADFILPKQTKALKCCRQCGLLKTSKQWESKRQCENCGQFTRVQIKQNITNGYDGLIGIVDPSKSFARRRAKIHSKNGGKLKSGLYGL